MTLTRRSLALLAATVLTIAPAWAQNVLRIGAYPSNPPFEFQTPEGVFVGFEVDILEEAAKRAGMRPEFNAYGFQALFTAVKAGEIDVAISSFTITPERLRTLSFTQPIYDADMGIAARVNGAVSGVAKLAGRTIGALLGSTGEAWALERQAAGGIGAVKGYSTQQELVEDLNRGRIDAMVSDVPSMEYAFTRMRGLAVQERIKTGEQYALMLAKDSPMLERLHAAIGSMKRDGTLAALHRKWFGTDAPAGASTITESPLPKL